VYKDSERELRFPLAVAVSYQNGEIEASTARSFVATWRVALLIAQRSRSNTATGSVQASKRPIALTSARGITTTRDPVVRFAIMLVAALLENLWLVLRWAVVARPRRGRARPAEEFTFKTFCDWIRHELEELRRRWKIKANGVGVPASQATAAG